MVTALHGVHGAAAPQAVAAWLATLHSTYSEADLAGFREVLEDVRARAGAATTPEGEPVAGRALGTATILASLRLDPASIRAALLAPAAGLPGFGQEALAEHFGDEVAALVAGAVRMAAIRAAQAGADAAERAAQAENLRKMVLAMVEDIRVVLLKLAERTHALRFLMGGDEARRRQVAQEVRELFAPLANRLGVWQLKWELEDLALRALEPDTYKRIAKLLDERRADRERTIAAVVGELERALRAAGLRAEVTGRPKHITSIWRKMQRKQSGIEALHDIRAFRILVDDVKDCYAALGVVHHLWTPVPGEFDDYIAKPKANDYRSLHTAVIGPDGRPLEVQIRTREMHQHSEYGVAAHWRYKEAGAKGVRADPGFDEKIAWLRQVLDWKDAVAAPEGALAAGLFAETIYVLTPQGKVVDLPRGATPVDFAYALHTNLGHRCRGARVDGQMVPLDTALATGQRVEIVTAKQGGPSRDWLNPDLHYVTSHRARTKVRQWFKAQQLEQTLAQGREIVDRELARAGRTALNLDALAARAGFAKPDELYAAVAREELNLRQLGLAIAAVAAPEAAVPAAAAPDLVTRESKAAGSGSGILVVGVDRLMTGLARCCKPAPPDPIVGFITRGKGISIHRAGCGNVARARATQGERLIEANWGALREAEVFPVDIVVEATDRQGLLRDISEVLSRERINVTAVNTLSRHHLARMNFTLEVRDLASLKRSLALIREVKGVLSAGRR